MFCLEPPQQGKKIKVVRKGTVNRVVVPDQPIITFIEGDGIGKDITPLVQAVINAAVTKAYGDNQSKKIHWFELYAGEKAVQHYGADQYLPQETLNYLQEYVVSLKGPLTTPIGGGIRSLNVAIRKQLDLYSIVRPIRYFSGSISPLKNPEKTNMVIFREAVEDVYAGIEWESNSKQTKQIVDYLRDCFGIEQIKDYECGLGIKYISKRGTERIMRRAVEYAELNGCPSITLVHKGNIMKYTEGAFRNWCYDVARSEYGAVEDENGQIVIKRSGKEIVVNDVIADNFLQKILLQPQDYSLILTMNLNGDYISDALAAQVGGLGFAPGANIGDECAVFEATHGTAPRAAGLNKANPSSLLLSGEMMLRYIGWNEAADLIISSIEKTLQAGIVTYDLTKGTNKKPASASDYAKALIERL